MSLFYHALAYTFEMMSFIFMGIIFVIYDLRWDMVSLYSLIIIMIIIVLARLVNILVVTAIYNYEYPKD